MTDRPNIVFINVDQWRGDCLGCSGHPVVETPHLDNLAREGVNFTNAYAGVPSCIAARASFMTGLTQESHGRVGYQDGVPWDYEVTLPRLLADAGYHTHAVGKMHVFPERERLGFHDVDLHDGYLHRARMNHDRLEEVDDYLPWLRARRGPEADYVDPGMGCNGYVVAPWCYDTMEHPSAWVTTKSIDFLRRRDPRAPFFLFTSYHRPHPPFDPPRDYLALYEDIPLPPVLEGDWNEQFPSPRRGLDSPVPTSETQRDRARRAYFAQITFIDHQINRLTHALHEAGVLENTVFLFCADHGDMLFDHNMVAKALPYESSCHIPFFLRFPRKSGFNREGTCEAPVELRDVLPTLCDIAGVEVPASVEGKSVLPFCRGEAPEWRDYVHGEHTSGQLSNHWLTDGKWKYAWYSQKGLEQLFNLEDDPGETRDLATKNPEMLQHFRQCLIRELDDREEGFVENGALVAGQTVNPILQSVFG